MDTQMDTCSQARACGVARVAEDPWRGSGESRFRRRHDDHGFLRSGAQCAAKAYGLGGIGGEATVVAGVMDAVAGGIDAVGDIQKDGAAAGNPVVEHPQLMK